MPDKRVILVTGMPRSGTTWVGRVLASAPRTAYVLEPLNVRRAPAFDLPVSHWFQRITDNSDPRFLAVFRSLASGRSIGRGEPPTLRGPTAPLRAAKHLAVRARDRWTAHRAAQIVFKDPIAILSADWFATRLDAQVVVTVRHPAAVVSSLLLQAWSPDYEDLFHPPEAIETFLPDAREWLADHPMSANQDERLYNASVMWRLLHRVVLHYQETNPNWIFVRHEDLSNDPTGQFDRLFSNLDLPFTTRTQSFLRATSTADGRDFVHERTPTNIIDRDTQAHAKVWKQRLTTEESSQIRELTEGVADEFYGDEDWE